MSTRRRTYSLINLIDMELIYSAYSEAPHHTGYVSFYTKTLSSMGLVTGDMILVDWQHIIRGTGSSSGVSISTKIDQVLGGVESYIYGHMTEDRANSSGELAYSSDKFTIYDENYGYFHQVSINIFRIGNISDTIELNVSNR